MQHSPRLEAIIEGTADPLQYRDRPEALIQWLRELADEVRQSRESIAKIRGRLMTIRAGLATGDTQRRRHSD